MKEVIIIGGPNGAGKTTAAEDLLPGALGIREFVNADNIARGLSSFNEQGSAFAAGRLMIERINALAHQGKSFAFETTCAGIGYLRLLKMCRTRGYRLTLIFLWLPSTDAALARVARRVAQGGHPVADDVVRRRYRAGLRNMRRHYLPLADIGLVYDNSDGARILIAERRPSAPLVVHDQLRWGLIEEASR
ncbi:MAG: AAA family ATPase [Xanthobacteraceae bacterium]